MIIKLNTRQKDGKNTKASKEENTEVKTKAVVKLAASDKPEQNVVEGEAKNLTQDPFNVDKEKEYENYKILDFEAFKKFLKEASDFLFASTLKKSGYIDKAEKELNKQVWRSVKFGFIVILVTVGLFVIWGGLAPLDSASIAQGYVTLSGNRKTIQHLEGGVIDKNIGQRW